MSKASDKTSVTDEDVLDLSTRMQELWRPHATHTEQAGTQKPSAAQNPTASTQTLVAAEPPSTPSTSTATQTAPQRVHNKYTQTTALDFGEEEKANEIKYSDIGTVFLPEFANFRLPEPTEEQRRLEAARLEEEERQAQVQRQEALRLAAQEKAAEEERERVRLELAKAKAVSVEQQIAERRQAFVSQHSIELARKKMKEDQLVKDAVRDVVKIELRAQVLHRLKHQIAMDEYMACSIASEAIRDVSAILQEHARDIEREVEAEIASEQAAAQQQATAQQQVAAQQLQQHLAAKTQHINNDNTAQQQSRNTASAQQQKHRALTGKELVQQPFPGEHPVRTSEGWYANAYDAPGMENLRELAMEMLFSGEWETQNEDQRVLYRRACKQKYEKRMERQHRRGQ